MYFSQTYIFSNLLQPHAGHILFKQQFQSGYPHTKLSQACGVMAEDKKPHLSTENKMQLWTQNTTTTLMTVLQKLLTRDTLENMKFEFGQEY